MCDEDAESSEEHALHRETTWPWPFVCVPLRSEGCRIGVLGVDGWSHVPLGRIEETHPETAVVNFLQRTGALLASALHIKRRSKALAALDNVFHSIDSTTEGVLEAFMVLLRETILFCTRIKVLEIRSSTPGVVYRRGGWKQVVSQQQDRDNGRGMTAPPWVLDIETATRDESLCIPPHEAERLRQLKNSSNMSASSLEWGPAPLQREVHSVAIHWPQSTSGLLASKLASKPADIIARFERIAAKPELSRPSNDGCFLVIVARALPGGPEDCAEQGDVTLVSDMCRRLNAGFTAMAGRLQQGFTRTNALARIAGAHRHFADGLIRQHTTIRSRLGLSASPSRKMRLSAVNTGAGSPALPPAGPRPRGDAQGSKSSLPLSRVTPPPGGRMTPPVALRNGTCGVSVHHKYDASMTKLPADKEQRSMVERNKVSFRSRQILRVQRTSREAWPMQHKLGLL